MPLEERSLEQIGDRCCLVARAHGPIDTLELFQLLDLHCLGRWIDEARRVYSNRVLANI